MGQQLRINTPKNPMKPIVYRNFDLQLIIYFYFYIYLIYLKL